jgi:hypothetical protein
MAQHALLNNIEHKSLRIITRRAVEYGDAVMYVATFPGEFRNLQSCYPIVFHKRQDTGAFQPLALFGLQEGQNLFLTESGWDASYVPLVIERAPFLIGRGPAAGSGAPELVVHVDLDSPRISTTEGELLFREYGGTTEYLDRMTSVLGAVHQGLEATPAFTAALTELDLLESFVLDVDLDDGTQRRLAGFYTINEDQLRALSGAQVAGLHERGMLQPIYMAIASMGHMRTLIERQRARGGRGEAGAVTTA